MAGSGDARTLRRMLADVKNVSLVGVLVGGVVDVVATNILAIPFVSYVLVQYGFIGQSPSQMQPALANAIHGNVWLTTTQWSIGLLGSVIGGYVAALIAKKHGLLNGALSSYLCICIGILTWNAPGLDTSPFVHLAAFILSPAFGAVGGYLRQIQSHRVTSTP